MAAVKWHDAGCGLHQFPHRVTACPVCVDAKTERRIESIAAARSPFSKGEETQREALRVIRDGGEAYSVEVARALGTTPGYTYHLLMRLVREGVLVSESRPAPRSFKRRYFRLAVANVPCARRAVGINEEAVHS